MGVILAMSFMGGPFLLEIVKEEFVGYEKTTDEGGLEGKMKPSDGTWYSLVECFPFHTLLTVYPHTNFFARCLSVPAVLIFITKYWCGGIL